MAILSEFEEDIHSKPTTSAAPPAKPFSAAFDPSNPLGFLEKVFEFVAKESDFFKSDSLVSDVNAVVRMVRDKVEAEGRKRKEVKSEGNGGKIEKKVKEATPAPPPPAVEKEEEVVESKVEEGKGPRAPNKGNGLDMEKYSWGQSLQEVNITVHVPSGTKSRFIACEIKKQYIKVGLKGQTPVIEGDLFHPVKVEDCFWSLEDQKSISILLTKQNQMEWWKYLVKGEPEVDTQKVEPENSKLSDLDPETRSTVEKMMERLKKFEQTLAVSPEDSTALEGAAVTLAEMREYKRAATLLEKLSEKKENDPDIFRLLGEVKYALQDYEGSANAYRSASMTSKSADFEVLRSLTNALLAAKKPDQAVQVLLASRGQLDKEKSSDNNDTVRSTTGTSSGVDPIQVDLLLGKAYVDWDHISDAVSVYDQLIANHPDDFRGYLAKGIMLKQNGSTGDAERMFIQARFFAPDEAKVLVDKYARR